METKAEVFKKIYQDYLFQISKLNLETTARHLNLKKDNDAVIIPFFGKPYRVSSKGIADADGKKPNHMICVILSKYLILYHENQQKQGDWVSYKDFKDAAPFVSGFFNTVERPIAEFFSGKPDELGKACKKIGGYKPDKELFYEISVQFDALPNIQVLLLFNDADSDFPAQCNLLFRKNAVHYLDVECLAMTGIALSDMLKNIGK